MYKIKVLDTPLSYYVKRLKANRPFSFIRYGNGEWDGILGTRPRTGSGSQLLRVPGLQKDLKKSLVRAYDPSCYLVGMQNYMKRRKEWSLVMKWLGVNAPGLTWHLADVFHWASSRAQLFPLIAQLRKMHLVFIGPAHIRPIHKRLPYEGFVEVRTRNCYQDKAKIREAILKQPKPAVFCFSAGPTTKPLIYELFPVLGRDSFLIDFGSLWDVYCGVPSRSYHKKITPLKTRINFGGSK